MQSEIRRAALNFLARREHSRTELFRKLIKKSFDETHIHAVLDDLIKEKLQSDERFTESFVYYRRNTGYGPLRIKAELKERDISDELITKHVAVQDEEWLSILQQVWKKRFKNQYPKDYASQVQQMRYLHYKGFTSEQITVFLKHIK